MRSLDDLNLHHPASDLFASPELLVIPFFKQFALVISAQPLAIEFFKLSKDFATVFGDQSS